MEFQQEIKHKTRVVVAGSANDVLACEIARHVFQYLEKNIDFVLRNEASISETGDFVLLNLGDDNVEFAKTNPNIALITETSKNLESYKKFISNITPGGILIYREEDPELANIVENSENYFRKIPYTAPKTETSNGIHHLVTDFGNIPLLDSNIQNFSVLEGVRLLCNQISILDEDFYEAVMSFKS